VNFAASCNRLSTLFPHLSVHFCSQVMVIGWLKDRLLCHYPSVTKRHWRHHFEWHSYYFCEIFAGFFRLCADSKTYLDVHGRVFTDPQILVRLGRRLTYCSVITSAAEAAGMNNLTINSLSM
jgi:hypothetical protein